MTYQLTSANIAIGATIIFIIIYLAFVITTPSQHLNRFDDVNPTDIPVMTSSPTKQPKKPQPSKKYKIRFIEPRTCYSKIDDKKRYSMQSYQQLFEYWFPDMDCELVLESEPADIAVIGNGNSDNSAIRPNEVNIFISIENVPYWNIYAHYSKYGDYNDPLIDIFIYNHKSSIEYLNDNKIMIPVVTFRINYFITNYDKLKISSSKPFGERKFCLMVNKSGLNNKIGQFQEKLNQIAPVDHISLYDDKIEQSSCYNSPELLEVFNQYKFIICFENSYNPGYITEKIFNCLLADTIPIYSGSPIINEFINADCFVNIPETANLDTEVNRIKEINADPELCKKYIHAPKISQQYLNSGVNTEFKKKYLESINNKLKK